MLREYKIAYTYECWKCPERHEGAAPMKANSPDEALELFIKESNEWAGVDGFEYNIEPTGVSWRP